MARSLTVKHEENLSVSPLFAGFVMLAIAVLLISAATGWSEPASAAVVAPVGSIAP
jgi:hypothetical protein